jgi:uncharacterized membrane protein
VTYATRIAGLFVADGSSRHGRAKAAFDAIPPAVLCAVIAPMALTAAGPRRSRRRSRWRASAAAAAPTTAVVGVVAVVCAAGALKPFP